MKRKKIYVHIHIYNKFISVVDLLYSENTIIVIGAYLEKKLCSYMIEFLLPL